MIYGIKYSQELTPSYPELDRLHKFNSTPKDKQIVGINGTWYNISKLVTSHPGGTIICDYFGRDATAVFKVWHQFGNGNNVLQEYLKSGKIKKVGTYKLELNDLDKILLKQHVKLINSGAYKTNYQWLISKLFVTFAITFTYFGLIYSLKNNYSWYIRHTFCALLALGWQQSGLLTHDAKHSTLCTDKGYKFVTILLVAFKVIYYLVLIVDIGLIIIIYIMYLQIPLMIVIIMFMINAHEIIWMNSNKQFSLKGYTYNMGNWQKCFINFQQYIFLPAWIMFGRLGFVIDSWRNERNILHLSCLGLHLFIYYKYLYIPFTIYTQGFAEFALFYFIAMLCQGVLTFQLLVSHYDKPFEHVDNHINCGWFRRQSSCVKDVKIPWYFDWFFGGLQFHLCHHVLPKLPTYNYRKTTKILNDLLIEYDENLKVDTVTFPQGIIDVMRHLRQVSIEYGAWNVMKQSMYTGELPHTQNQY